MTASAAVAAADRAVGAAISNRRDAASTGTAAAHISTRTPGTTGGLPPAGSSGTDSVGSARSVPKPNGGSGTLTTPAPGAPAAGDAA